MIAAHDKISFFKIPREIRDKIYRIVFETPGENDHWYYRIQNYDSDGRVNIVRRNDMGGIIPAREKPLDRPPRGHISLLLICRQITSEATEVLFSMKTFVVDIETAFAMNNQSTKEVEMLKTWLSVLPTAGIKSIVIQLRLSSVLDIACQMRKVDEDDWGEPENMSVCRFEPGKVLSKAKFLKELGLNDYGVPDQAFRVECRSGGYDCQWVSMGDGDYDIWQLEQERLKCFFKRRW